MTTTPKITTISGSLRRDSFNRKLLAEAVRLFGPCEVTEADLHLPLYDGDLENAEGVPEAVKTLAAQIAGADAVIISTPEYNQSLSGVLKNALDWVSRTEGAPWQGKPVAILSAAAGRAGGARASYALRLCMAPFRPNLVAGPEILIAGAHKEFDEAGHLTSDFYRGALTDHMAALRQAAGG